MSEKIVMGYWDCPYCGHKKILGTAKDCPNCGHVRDANTTFYMSGAPTYLSAEESKTKGKGADWLCPSCGRMNSVLSSTCEGCGQLRSKTTANYFDLHDKVTYKDVNHNGSIDENEIIKREKVTEPKPYVKDDEFSDISKDEEDTSTNFIHSINKNRAKDIDRCANYDKVTDSIDDTAEFLDKTILGVEQVEGSIYDTKNNKKTIEENSDEIIAYNTVIFDEDKVKAKPFDEAIHNGRNAVENIISNVASRMSTVDWKFILQSVLVLVSIIGAVAFIIHALSPHQQTITVTSKPWKRVVSISEYKTVNEDDWYLPSGGRLNYTREEIHHYVEVLDHYDTVTKSRTVADGGHYETSYSSNGDGTFTEHSTWVTDYTTEYYTEQVPVYRDEPVYRTKYYYNIDEWVPSRKVTTSGTDNEPYWGKVVLVGDGTNTLGNEKESGRSETYKITYVREDKKKKPTNTREVDFADYNKFTIGKTYEMMVSPTLFEFAEDYNKNK